MLLTEEQALKRLSSSQNLINHVDYDGTKDVEIRPTAPVGRSVDSKEVPAFLKGIAAVAAQVESPTTVGPKLGIKSNQIYAYRQGRTGHSPSCKNDPELQNQIDQSLGVVKDLALTQLMRSLDLIEDNLEIVRNDNENDKVIVRTTKLSQIAKDMSQVVDKITPKIDASVSNTQIIVYSPQIKKLDTFEVIEADRE
jgi:hypothetical protein